MANVRQKIDRNKRIVGLVPAAGQATRLSPLPLSKELYPIGHMHFKGSDGLRPKPVCIYLLEKMKIAGIKDVFIVIRKSKWDIPAYLGDGSLLEMNFAYLMMNLPFGVPYSLNQALPFTKDSMVAFGFPDIIFQPDNAYKKLLTHQAKSKADVVLGLFPVDQPNKFHMVELNKNRRITKIDMNPVKTHLKYTWIIAVWTSKFSEFIYSYLKDIKEIKERTGVNKTNDGQRELQLSEVIQHAINRSLLIEGVIFSKGHCLDIGTSVDLFSAIQKVSESY